MSKGEGRPPIINVTGLKKSGKTTVAEGLIIELLGRGYRVGAVKTARHDTLTLDTAGADTRRFADAGAAFVIALLDTETHYFERRSERSSVRDVSRLFAPGVQLVVCEGTAEPDLDPVYVVCLRAMGELEETLRIRGVEKEKLVAISGPAAAHGRADGPDAGHAAPGAGERHRGDRHAGAKSLPAFDITSPPERAALADILIRACGSPRPAAAP